MLFLPTVFSEAPGRASINNDNKSKGILLVVDDDPEMRKTLKRILSIHFDSVLTAGTPEEANEILSRHDVTQIVSDYDLGGNHPRGTELIVEWRKRYPSIRRALLFTATYLSESRIPEAVDHFFLKSENHNNLIKALMS